jgi:hypothetical protein
MFKKLNVSFSELEYAKLKGELAVKYPTFTEFFILDKNYLFDILNKQIKFNIRPNANISEVIYPGANPHTDKWPTSINFYLDAGNDETSFWKEIVSSTEAGSQPVDRTSGPKSYKEVPLEKTGSFVANTGDCYLMNVWAIHSVKINTMNITRKILRLYWDELSFDEVLQSIEIINELTE